jgi:hypothetical protein
MVCRVADLCHTDERRHDPSRVRCNVRVRVRKADIDPKLREQLELFGKDVVAITLGIFQMPVGGPPGAMPMHAQMVIFNNQAPAMKWLQQKRDEAERHETVTLVLEIAIVILIGVEIILSVASLVK